MSRGPLGWAPLAAASLGGACGALLRWWLTEVHPDGPGFGWTTFAINVVGSGLLALLPLLVRHRLVLVGLGPGLLGGFTTMSAYAAQGRALLADGRLLAGTAYVLGTVLACVLAVHLVRAVTGAGRPDREEVTS